MRGKRRSHLSLAALAGEQHGVVSRRQLEKLGYSEDTIANETGAGRLHPLHRGVYAVGHAAVSREARCLAGVLAAGSGALLSHRSAAWLWGLSNNWREPVEVTAASPRLVRPTLQIHSAQTLREEDLTSLEGIPVTAVPRTLLDFAAVAPRSLGRALDRAERRGLLDLAAIEVLIGRSVGLRGVARLRDGLEVFRVPAFTRSGLERRFVWLVERAGLPRPSMNLFVAGYELDAYWPAESFAVELDTYEYHGGRVSFETDRLRQEDLKLAGIEMVRVTGARLGREPEVVMARLRKLLTQRRRNLGHPG